MDAIKHLEQKLNQLAITLCPPTEPIGKSPKQIYKHFMYHSEENISRKFIITRHSHIEWK